MNVFTRILTGFGENMIDQLALLVVVLSYYWSDWLVGYLIKENCISSVQHIFSLSYPITSFFFFHVILDIEEVLLSEIYRF